MERAHSLLLPTHPHPLLWASSLSLWQFVKFFWESCAVHVCALTVTHLYSLTPLSTQIIRSKSVVLKPNTTDFEKSVVFESNTTDFPKHDLSCILWLSLCICVFFFVFLSIPLSFHHILLSSQQDVQWSRSLWLKMIMTILDATPLCDLEESVFGRVCTNTQCRYTNTQIQTRSDILTLSVSNPVPKLIESESQRSTLSVISIHGAEGIDEKMSWC